MNNPPRVLIVDDQPDNLVLLEAFLRPEGYEVRKAPDGPRAVALAREDAPDLVLLDVLMPGMDGFAVCRALRGNSRTRFVPVIMITALQETEDRIRGLEAGADDFVSKPVQDDLLLAKIRSLLRLKKMRDELDGIRTDFGNMMVHDLRAPVHTILGLVELLREDLGAMAGSPSRLLDLVEKSARGIDTRITDFLELARLESGRLKLNRARTDVVQLAREALERFGPVAGKKRLNVRLEAPGDPVLADVDAGRLEQVFDNLLQNAVKFSPAGGGITVRVSREAATVRCRVEDEGPGFPAADSEALFEKYFQRDGRQGGVGLGLYVCRAVVEAHGGSIRAENRPGGGARFTFELPLHEP
ncbi:MAG: response regulator [Acidobacteria bacterium]|nr:response regulator [Acidobacteriota bacterium]